MATESLAVHLLGEFRVSVGPRAIAEREWTLRKANSLVKLLALAPHHRLHREQVIDQLWPDMDPEDGANNLTRRSARLIGALPTRDGQRMTHGMGRTCVLVFHRAHVGAGLDLVLHEIEQHNGVGVVVDTRASVCYTTRRNIRHEGLSLRL